MIEVAIESINVNLVSQSRVVILRERGGERRLPIWIGQFEAEAITMSLQEVEAARPMTHDLLKSMLSTLGGALERVEIFDLREDVFYARLIVRANGQTVEVDSRPSDGLALAVRVRAPIWVDESVMDKAGILPEKDIRAQSGPGVESPAGAPDERLEIFKDFMEKLDTDDEKPADDSTA